MSDNSELEDDIESVFDWLSQRHGQEAACLAIELKVRRGVGRPRGHRMYSIPTLLADIADDVVSGIPETRAFERVAGENWKLIGSASEGAAEKGLLRAFKQDEERLLKDARERRSSPAYLDLEPLVKRTSLPDLMAMFQRLGPALSNRRDELLDLQEAVRQWQGRIEESGGIEALARISRSLPDKN